MKPTELVHNAEGNNKIISTSRNNNSNDNSNTNSNSDNNMRRQARTSSINENQRRIIPGTSLARNTSARDEPGSYTTETSTTHTRTPHGILTPIHPERPVGAPQSARDGSGVRGRQAQQPRTPQADRQPSHRRQYPSGLNDGVGQSERTASRPPVSVTPQQSTRPAERGCEIKTEVLGSAFPSVSSNTSHPQGMGRFGNPLDFSPYSRSHAGNHHAPSARPQAGFNNFPLPNSQNGFHPSPYQQPGATMGFQHGQYPHQHPYYPHYPPPYGANEFCARSNPGQIPPQSGSAFSAHGGFGVNAAMPYDPPGFYYQPPLQPTPHGFPQPYGSANRRPETVYFTGNSSRYPGVPGLPHGTAVSRPGSRYDDSDWLWPCHLSSRVRHDRGSFSNEELHTREMVSPDDDDGEAAKDPSPATSPASVEIVSIEERRERGMGSPGGGNRGEAMNTSPASSAASVEIVSISSTDEDDDGEPPRKKIKLPATKTDKRYLGPHPMKKIRRDHGQVRNSDDGSIWFRANGASEWEPTVRHGPNRAAMVADARAAGDYVVAPAGGVNDDDRTSYLPAHREWYYHKPHHWHHPSMDEFLYRLQREDLPDRTDRGGPLRWRGSVVLNNEDLVMTDWPELPMTLSSRIEGWRLEMIYRRDDRVVARDILDRMPPRPDGGHCMTASALGNKRGRFREQNGLVSWQHMDGTARFYDAVRSRLTPLQIARNSTKGFLGLGVQKLAELKAENRKRAGGAYLKKAGKNLLTDEQRKAAIGRPARLNATERLQEMEQSDESQSESQQHHSERSTPAEPSKTNNEQAGGEDGGSEYETGDEGHDAENVPNAEPPKTADEETGNENKDAGREIEDEHHDFGKGDPSK